MSDGANDPGPDDIVGYVVLNAQGKLKVRGRYNRRMRSPTSPASFFQQKSSAMQFAKDDGDTVMAVRVFLRHEPVFIRSKKL